jgi:hypothetical protein
MDDFDRPDDLDPAPPGFNEWLDARTNLGTTMLEERLGALLEESDPTLYLGLLDGELMFATEGPDERGVFTMTVMRAATGAEEARMEVHWRALLRED